MADVTFFPLISTMSPVWMPSFSIAALSILTMNLPASRFCASSTRNSMSTKFFDTNCVLLGGCVWLCLIFCFLSDKTVFLLGLKILLFVCVLLIFFFLLIFCVVFLLIVFGGGFC
jgi:hypothetical protein